MRNFNILFGETSQRTTTTTNGKIIHSEFQFLLSKQFKCIKFYHFKLNVYYAANHKWMIDEKVVHYTENNIYGIQSILSLSICLEHLQQQYDDSMTCVQLLPWLEMVRQRQKTTLSFTNLIDDDGFHWIMCVLMEWIGCNWNIRVVCMDESQRHRGLDWDITKASIKVIVRCIECKKKSIRLVGKFQFAKTLCGGRVAWIGLNHSCLIFSVNFYLL